MSVSIPIVAALSTYLLFTLGATDTRPTCSAGLGPGPAYGPGCWNGPGLPHPEAGLLPAAIVLVVVALVILIRSEESVIANGRARIRIALLGGVLPGVAVWQLYAVRADRSACAVCSVVTIDVSAGLVPTGIAFLIASVVVWAVLGALARFGREPARISSG